jgi:hypothetical protein
MAIPSSSSARAGTTRPIARATRGTRPQRRMTRPARTSPARDVADDGLWKISASRGFIVEWCNQSLGVGNILRDNFQMPR